MTANFSFFVLTCMSFLPFRLQLGEFGFIVQVERIGITAKYKSTSNENIYVEVTFSLALLSCLPS